MDQERKAGKESVQVGDGRGECGWVHGGCVLHYVSVMVSGDAQNFTLEYVAFHASFHAGHLAEPVSLG